jgi:hypothetical protein
MRGDSALGFGILRLPKIGMHGVYWQCWRVIMTDIWGKFKDEIPLLLGATRNAGTVPAFEEYNTQFLSRLTPAARFDVDARRS